MNTKTILIIAGIIVVSIIIFYFVTKPSTSTAAPSNTLGDLSKLLGSSDCKGTCKSVCKSKPIFSLNHTGRNACQGKCETDCSRGKDVSKINY